MRGPRDGARDEEASCQSHPSPTDSVELGRDAYQEAPLRGRLSGGPQGTGRAMSPCSLPSVAAAWEARGSPTFLSVQTRLLPKASPRQTSRASPQTTPDKAGLAPRHSTDYNSDWSTPPPCRVSDAAARMMSDPKARHRQPAGNRGPQEAASGATGLGGALGGPLPPQASFRMTADQRLDCSVLRGSQPVPAPS